MAKQWDANSYFRILKEGKTGEASEANTKVLTAQELEDDGFVTYHTATILIGLADVDSYLESATVSFAEYLPTLMEGVTSAKFTSVNAKNPSLIDNSIIQALMNTKVRILNLSGVKIPEIVSPYASNDYSTMNSNATFVMASNKLFESNQYIETLYTPQVNPESELKWQVFARLNKLRYLYLSEGIETLGEKAIPCNGGCKLSALSFPNSLKYIKKDACSDHYAVGMNNKVYNEETGKYDDKEVPWIETLVFPAGLQEIESYAFGRTCPKDVYFLGTEAPKVGKHAFGDNGYLGNYCVTPTVSEGEGEHPVEVNMEDGNAVQANYHSQSGWIMMTGYEMEPGAPIPTQIYASETGASQPSEDEENFSYRFIGTYMPNICMPQYSYFFSKAKNIFRFQGGTTGKWNPYTAIVQAPLGDEDNQIFFGGNGDNNNAKMFTGLNEMADGTTGVNQVTIEIDGEKVQDNGNIYNLNGQLVSRHGIDHLQKGIYVANGKKVLVK